MEDVVCQDCGNLFPYDGQIVKICTPCTKARIERAYRKVLDQ
jgi:hypothetical protein